MENSKVLTNILPNEDDYSWKILNCMYKPSAIVVKAFNKSYEDFFYSIYSFATNYGIRKYLLDFESGNHLIGLFPYLIETLEEFFNISCEKVKFSDKDDFHETIRKKINNNEIPLISGDLKGLYYNTMYQLKSHAHVFIVKGYDADRKIYYLMDNLHLEGGASTYLKYFFIKFDDLYEICHLFPDSYSYFFSQKGSKSEEELINTLIYLIKSISDKKIPAYTMEKLFLENLTDKKRIQLLDEKIAVANMRHVFYRATLSILEKYNADKNLIEKVKNEYPEIIKNWEKLRTKEIILDRKQSSDISKLQETYDSFLQDDLKSLKTILEALESINTKSISKNQNYQIINTQNAKISGEKNNFIISLDDGKIYEDWVSTYNAPKIFWKNEGKPFSFGFELKINGIVGDSYHAGLIIELENEKFYFGNIKQTQTVIFCPQRNDNFTLFEENFTANKFKIDFSEDGILSFFADDKMIYTEKISSKILNYGIFAKTWDFTNVEVEFNIL